MPHLFVVDPCFKEQFQLPNATPEYQALWQELPNLFVGTAEQLVPIVELMCTQVCMLHGCPSDTPSPPALLACSAVVLSLCWAVYATHACRHGADQNKEHGNSDVTDRALCSLFPHSACSQFMSADAEGVCRHSNQLPTLAHTVLHADQVAAKCS